MAMTKREKEEMESLRQQLREAVAFRFTEDVKPDVPPPEGGSGRLSVGFQFRLGGLRVYSSRELVEALPSCSSCVGHGYGTTKETTTQNPWWMYSSKLLALRAARRELEKQYSRALASVDEQIEKELWRVST